MEVLGFEDTPESQFGDQSFVKLQYPSFIDLLNNNKFLGVGNNYLHSDQIVKVRFIGSNCLSLIQLTFGQALCVIIRGPGSIKTLKNPSRSRMNRFGLHTISPPLLAFTTTVVSLLK